jgi:D-alanyl-D-alanine carboxypeptidase/D-alanyl-D-alanine-endopeptidase (penicillin-binding protein 4)
MPSQHSAVLAPVRLGRRSILGLPLVAGIALARTATAQPESLEVLAARGVAELERWVKAQGAELGARVIELANGRALAESAADRGLNPASTQKILTVAAALDRLGPAYCFVTSLHGRQTGDTLDQLVLRGDGDPDLGSGDLLALVERLWQRGVRRIQGDVLVDQSAFDTGWDPPAYEQRPDDSAAYRAPVSAVAVDGNTVTLHVQPTAAGSRALVWLEPAGIGRIDGAITSTDKAKRPESVGLTITPSSGQVLARVSGSVESGRPMFQFARRLPNPETAPAHVLVALLGRMGIRVSGRAAAGGAGVQAELARHESRPLSQLVHALGKRSDNFYAEMLLKALGRGPAKTGLGSSSSGAAAIEAFLKARNAFSPGMQIRNGSGLFDANRVSAASLTRVLELAYADTRIGPELTAALAIGGVDGTLASRFPKSAADRRVRAKTGTLSSVIALSGYLFGPRPLAFAFLMNGLPGKQTEARRRIDGVLESLSAAR